MITFPSVQDGAIILGPIERSADTREIDDAKAEIRATIFGHYHNPDGRPTGRKVLRRHMKGMFVSDYYMDKHEDIMLTNFEGREKQLAFAEKRDKGKGRRRPQKKEAGKSKKK